VTAECIDVSDINRSPETRKAVRKAYFNLVKKNGSGEKYRVCKGSCQSGVSLEDEHTLESLVNYCRGFDEMGNAIPGSKCLLIENQLKNTSSEP
jgi:hypothetical protein